ncbi:hypothetical protein GCM10010246_83570 [Streptomyces cuspidosporus]|uniref:Secreted protein n=1 Tax=Streptomyces cuspidosporus TaxID=66882 RepID=A0ABN3HCF7_9ACTN
MSRICSAVLCCAAPVRCVAVGGDKQSAVRGPQCNTERAVKVYQTGPRPVPALGTHHSPVRARRRRASGSPAPYERVTDTRRWAAG